MKRVLAPVLAVWLCLLCACAKAPATVTATTTSQSEGPQMTTTITELTTEATVSAETNATAEATTEQATIVATETTTTVGTTAPKKTVVVTKGTTKKTTTVKTTVTTQAKPEPLRILSIGNSYSMDAQHYLSALGAHEGREIYTVNLMHSGCRLQQHYEFWQKNEPAYQYEVNGKIDWNSHVSLMDVLPSEKWDVVTLQEESYSNCTGSGEQYLKTLINVIKFHAPQAKIYLHQTWAYGDGYIGHDTRTGGDMAAMWEKVRASYDYYSEITELPLIPSGMAMFEAQQGFNARGLGESIQRDKTHASESWGRYLLALVWYKTLAGETPSNTFEGFDGFYIPDDDVRKMIHATAMKAVDAYYP